MKNMKEVLSKLFEKAIELGDFTYNDEQIRNKWLGNPPTTMKKIKEVEKKFKVEFPDDYVEMLLIANGFPAVNDVEPSFEPIEKIILYKDYENNAIREWKEYDELREIGELLEISILIGGINEEQQFLLIPPKNNNNKWKYWTFSFWMPGENEYSNLTEYFTYCIKFMEEIINNEN